MECVLWAVFVPLPQEDKPVEEGGLENGSGDGEESEGGREGQRDSQLAEDFRKVEDSVSVINRHAEGEESKVCV